MPQSHNEIHRSRRWCDRGALGAPIAPSSARRRWLCDWGLRRVAGRGRDGLGRAGTGWDGLGRVGTGWDGCAAGRPGSGRGERRGGGGESGERGGWGGVGGGWGGVGTGARRGVREAGGESGEGAERRAGRAARAPMTPGPTRSADRARRVVRRVVTRFRKRSYGYGEADACP